MEETGAAADSLGPIPQAAFLMGLGIEQRLEALLAGATPAQAGALRAGYARLVGGSEPGAALTEEGMGSSYQAFCIAQRGLQPWPFGAVQMGDSSASEDEGEEEAEEVDVRQPGSGGGEEPGSRG